MDTIPGTWVKSLILPAGNTSLLIETSREGWAKCYLVGEKCIYLGADGVEDVLSRLYEALNRSHAFEGLAAGEMQGVPVVWRLSLMEVHHVLYVGDDGADRVLFWQNAHTSPVSIAGVMRLSPVQRQGWIETLNKILKEVKKPTLMAA